MRWSAWWKGSVYVNPLQDILDHLGERLRNTIDPEEEWVVGEMGSVFFSGGRLTVRDPFRRRQVYEFYRHLRIEIHYTTLEKAKTKKPFNSWISFPDYHKGKKIPFVFQEEKIRRLTSFLLQKEINFKEYMNGKRAFRCRYLDSEQIDHVIEKYGIEW